MRLWTREKEASGLKKRETGRAQSRDCSRLINARVSLTSARDKNHRRPGLPIESPRDRPGGESVRENNFLLVGHTLSFLLLSNDASVVPRPEREERRHACVNLLERFLAISESRTLATRRRAGEQAFNILIACGRVLRRLLNMITSMDPADAKCAFRWSKKKKKKKRQLSIASLFMQQLHWRLLLNGIILHRAQQFLSSSSVSTGFLTQRY